MPKVKIAKPRLVKVGSMPLLQYGNETWGIEIEVPCVCPDCNGGILTNEPVRAVFGVDKVHQLKHVTCPTVPHPVTVSGR